MYFNNKENTNIDKEFKKERKFNIKEIFSKYKLFIIIGFILLIILLVFLFIPKKENNKIAIEYFLTLEGSTDITLYKDAAYVEPGYTAYDNNGNDLINKVTITDNLDTSIVGDYTITYTIENVTKTRTIHIIEKPTGATYIHLKGDDIIYLNIGDTYSEPGCVVIDTVDSNLTSKVITKNNIDSSKAGIYEVTYTVTNSSGVTTNATRKVIVMDSNISLSIKSNKAGQAEISIYVNDNYFDYLLLPNGEKIKEKEYTYTVTESKTYEFTEYNTKGSSSKESITVEVAPLDEIAPTIISCDSLIKDNKTYITVKSNDTDIAKYTFNGNETTNNTYTLDGKNDTVTVVVYDQVGNNSNYTCNSYYEKISPTSSNKIKFQETSDTMDLWIESTDGLYVSHIWVKDAYNQLKTAVPTNFGKERKTVKDLLSQAINDKSLQNKTVIAVNASGFVLKDHFDSIYAEKISGWNETSVSPIVIVDGKVLRDYASETIPLTKHVTYGLKSDGYLEYYYYQKGTNLQSNLDLSQKIISDGVKYTFAFCPVIVKDGVYSPNGVIGKYNGSSVNKDRNANALCQIDKNNFIIITTNTTTKKFSELAEKMISYGCVTGFSLDGGGSTSLYYKSRTSTSSEELVNKESRKVADILYFHE